MLSTSTWGFEVYHNNPYGDESEPYRCGVFNDFLEATSTARFKRRHYGHNNFGIASPAKYPNGEMLRHALRID